MAATAESDETRDNILDSRKQTKQTIQNTCTTEIWVKSNLQIIVGTVFWEQQYSSKYHTAYHSEKNPIL